MIGKKIKSTYVKIRSIPRWVAFPLELLAAVLLLLTVYNIAFAERAFPNVSVNGTDISGLTKNESVNLVSKKIDFPKTITIAAEGKNLELDTSAFNLKISPEESVNKAFAIHRTGKLTDDFVTRITALWQKNNLPLVFTYDEQKLDETLSVLVAEVGVEAVGPSISYTDKQIVVTSGQKGLSFDKNDLKQKLDTAFGSLSTDPIEARSEVIDPTITKDQKTAAFVRAEKYLKKTLTLTFEYNNLSYTTADILPLLNPAGGYRDESLERLADDIASVIERNPQNPTFVFEEGRVKEFAPSKPGVTIKRQDFKSLLTQKLDELADADTPLTAAIPYDATPSEVTTESVNNLGIKELIGRGSSHFAGSIPSRVYNVNLAATRLNGILIAPGETFSFNGSLGDVSKLTGYKEAYVIKDGKTVLGDGGGVCQVSTTLFRAAMDAGLPIIERRAHAYRVGYYEQDAGPGLDATVYSPTTDFKFKNDTPAHILIQAYPDTKNLTLVFELYGTSDGRVSNVTKPVIASVTPAGEDLYIDDPTLPAGKVVQTEHRANGAKVTFNYSVKKDGEITYEKTFVSNYRPWQAVYLRGTGQ